MPDAAKPATAFDPAPLIEAAKEVAASRVVRTDWKPDHTGVRVKEVGKGGQVVCKVSEVCMHRGAREASTAHIATSNPAAILAWGERDAEQQAEIKALREEVERLRMLLQEAAGTMLAVHQSGSVVEGASYLHGVGMNIRALLEPSR